MEEPKDVLRLFDVRGAVYQALEHAVSTSVTDWAEMFLGFDVATFRGWAEKIDAERWIDDPEIQETLELYCFARDHRQRGRHFICLLRRVLSLARAAPKSAGPRNTPSLGGIAVVENMEHAMEKIPEHGLRGAERVPDVLLMRMDAVPTGEDLARWNDVLTWFEVLIKWDLRYKFECIRAKTPLAENAKTTADKWSKNKPKSLKTPAKGRTSDARARHRGSKRARDTDDDIEEFLRRLETASQPTSQMVDLDESPGALLCGSYALELLTGTRGSRASCFGVAVEDDYLKFWHYDACGIVYTDRGISFMDNFEAAAALLVAIANCTPAQFGAVPLAVMRPLVSSSRDFPSASLAGCTFPVRMSESKKEVLVTLLESIATEYAITGRRSFTYTAQLEPIPRSMQPCNGRVIVKFSYQLSSRDDELELIQEAVDAGVENLPTVLARTDLWTLQDCAREVALRKKRVVRAKTTEAMRALSSQTDAQGFLLYEDRILRATVYPDYGSIAVLFTKNPELIPVMVDQMLDCLRDMMYKAHILHRNISVDNIMYEIRDGTHHFVLTDFGMAVRIDTGAGNDAAVSHGYIASPKDRPGTLIFAASELLLDTAHAIISKLYEQEHIPRPHFLRHDYESLFHVAFWSVTALERPADPYLSTRSLARRALRLATGNLEQLGEHKDYLCTWGLVDENIHLPPSVNILHEWFFDWTTFFGDVYSVRNSSHRKLARARRFPATYQPPAYDDETINGLFTCETLKAALSSAKEKILNPTALPSSQSHISANAELEAESSEFTTPTKSNSHIERKKAAPTADPEDINVQGSSTEGDTEPKDCSAKGPLELEQKREASRKYRAKLRSSKR